MSSILVLLEAQSGGAMRTIAWEALSAAQQLSNQNGLPIDAVVLGATTEPLATEAAAKGVRRVLRVEHPLLTPYTADGYTSALEQLITAEAPSFVVMPNTYQLRDFAPALATRFGQSLICDVVGIHDGPTFSRLLLQGRLVGSYRASPGGICFVSVQAGAFPAAILKDERQTESAEVVLFRPTLEASSIRTRPEEPFRASVQSIDLTAAERIVSVGRGIGEKENLPIVEELARALGAELAASRPICDNGWLSLDHQVGSSGQTVAPKLYVAVGISGAIQHLVGMKASQCIVAINKDPDAPIFEVADYGIVGDLFEVVPAITAALKAAKA